MTPYLTKVRAGKQSISPKQAEILWDQDYNDARNSIRKEVKNFDSLPPEAQNILVDLTFNMGSGRFPKDFPRAIAAFRAGDLKKAADELHYTNGRDGPVTPYYEQTGYRAKGIIYTLRNLENKRNAPTVSPDMPLKKR